MPSEEALRRLDEEMEADKRMWKQGYMVNLCCSCRRCVPLGKRRKCGKAVTFFGAYYGGTGTACRYRS